MYAVSFVEFAIQICKNYRTHDNLCHLAIYMTSQIISCYNVPSQCHLPLKVNYRVFALDVVCELLAQPARQCEAGQLTPEEEERVQCKFLIKTILSRCSDKAAG